MPEWTYFGRGTRIGIFGEPKIVNGSCSRALPFYLGRLFIQGQPLPTQLTEDDWAYMRMYGKEDDMSTYFKLLRSCSHLSIIKVWELVEDGMGNTTISFETVNCSLKSFIVSEAKNLRTIPKRSIETVDFALPMVRILRQIASGISYLHMRDISLGSLQLDNIYVKFDNTYKPNPEEVYYATVKLLPDHEGVCTQDKDVLKDNKKNDWVMFGHLVEEVSVILCINGNIEIRSRREKIISGQITKYEELFSEPSMWYEFQKRYFIHHMFEALKPKQFAGACLRGWTTNHQNLLSRFPTSRHDASKDDKAVMVDNEADSHQHFESTFFGFYDCLRVIIVHFERANMSAVRTLISFQGYHPTLLLDLIRIARNGNHRTKMVLKGLIKKITVCLII